ncbi:MAG: hypothetical protein NTV31_03160 [Bacteroidia bacterium]|nr:hypothetical protein [Bacteroidia bacterium]
MKKSLYISSIVLVFSILSISIFCTNCKKSEDAIKFPKGTFPDSVMNLSNINSAYDDYNLTLNQLNGNSPVIFSSNRRSSGGQFELEQANISFVFDQTNGSFELLSAMTNDAFLDKLINKAKTPGNDFGPYRLFNSSDGYEYFLLASENGAGNLDLYYLKNSPVFGSSLPDVDGPYPINLLNTSYDDAYICFDTNLDSAYFVSNIEGNFDIFLQKKPSDKEIAAWFDLDYTVSTKVDSVNSSGEDKCPLVFRNVLVFTSNRPGGLGGFDLYYSIFRKGKWSSPVNLGPGVNTSSDEYRPVIGYHPDFTNLFMMFSSNRPGGKGGFDLYFTGVTFPEK